jgi:hypothetical protein
VFWLKGKKPLERKNVTNTLSRQYFMGGNAYCVAKRGPR